MPTEPANDLYAPTLQGVAMPQFLVPQTRPMGGPAVGIYAPSSQAPGLAEMAAQRTRPRDRRIVQTLYAPVFQASDSGQWQPARRPSRDCHQALGMYSPIGPPDCALDADEGQFASVAAADCWDEGVIGPRVGHRRGMNRDVQRMYSSGADCLMLLYNTDFAEPTDEGPPRELSKVSLPAYRLEPPDTIQIDILKLVPRAPYRVEIYDVLNIGARGTIPDRPINNYYMVDGEGQVDLGPGYGTVRITGMTIEQATDAITKQLRLTLREPDVVVQLARSAGTQQVAGYYVIQPDGMVSLRSYGAVYVAGKTMTEAQVAIERHLAQYFDSPKVSVDVTGFNSKSYYVVVAGAGMGEQIQRLPITGNETVLDALSHLGGLARVSSKTMWVSRPTPGRMGCEEVLPVDFAAITRGAMTDTNYQLLPGDRLYVVDDKLMSTNSYITKVTTPISRLLSISSLGSSTINTAQTMGRGFNQSRR
jgi:polysaccharide biosynthesis/export protein